VLSDGIVWNAAVAEEPLLGGVGVGGGFGSSEGLGSNQEESGFWVRMLQGLRNVGTVNVGDEVKGHAILSVWLKSLGNHDWTTMKILSALKVGRNGIQICLQIRSTNTDVDDVGQWLSGVTSPGTASDLLSELLHVLQDGVNVLNDTLSVNAHWLVGDITESSVVDGAVFGEVDLLTLEHCVSQALYILLLGQLDQTSKDLLVDDVLGEVEKNLRSIRGVLEGL
jgi:hypothetical protein